jgi:signal transduction histidine kinase/DNA-binding response OmpR family regulator
LAPVETVRKRASVLLVDDVQSNLLALAALLKPLGPELVEAQTPRAALEAVRHEAFAVALIDVQMPEMDGFEVARAIRKLDHGRELPILFVTAIYREDSFARHGYQLGGADYITKPFDADIVKARVKAFIDLFERGEKIHATELSARVRERDEALRRATISERLTTAASDRADELISQLAHIYLGSSDSVDSLAVFLRQGDQFRLHEFVGTKRHAYEKLAIRLSAESSKSSAPLLNSRFSTISELPEVQSVRVTALLHEGAVLGAIAIGSNRSAAFSENDQRLLPILVERTALAAAKRLEYSQFFDVLTAVPALIGVIQVPSMRYAFANPRYRALFGGRELLGASAIDFAMSSEILALIRKAQISGSTAEAAEVPVLIEGHEHFFQFSAQPLHNHAGRIDRVLTFATDITNQVEARRKIEAHEAERSILLAKESAARAEAERASRAKDDFLAMISHELRTPMQAILGWTALARPKANPELQPALETIERNALRQARIIEDLLDISRIVNGNLQLELRPIQLRALIASAVESLRPAANAKEITIDSRVIRSREFSCDIERIQQVLGNALSNALKFTREGGRVEIRAEGRPQSVLITIADNGEGFDPALASEIFEPFRQADVSPTRRHSGLGLGLTIAKRLTEAHGGRIEAASAGRGHGTTVTIELPLQAPNGNSSQKADRPNVLALDHQRLEGIKILLVEDDPDARELLEILLTREGALVKSVSSAADGLFSIKTFLPDVLLSDIAMPDMDGNEFMRLVRHLPSALGGETPGIAISAHGRAEDREQAAEAGFQSYFIKPIDISRLVASISSLRKGRAESTSMQIAQSSS